MGSKKRPTLAKTARSGGGGSAKPPRGSSSGGGSGDGASLAEETKRRYLNYAMSVITARALPDVRDGLKPVQRRILFAMHHDEHLSHDAKYRKSAKVVGTVIGRYHPHGDTAVYDAMVRMAQDFSLRMPLVDGSGNFGSVDGDRAAAYRYTECRLTKPSMEMLSELKKNTVDYRGNYDGTTTEPIVLPARIPNLLVNGSTGIAVGMATNIPPHNLREVCEALVALIENRDLTTTNILKYIKGPDFPLGGQILNAKTELRSVYENGTGPIKVRAEYKVESRPRGGQNIIITSIPYAVNKSTIVEKIADAIIGRKVPQLVDVRDESTTEIRIVLELKKGASADVVMAYLFKNTPLQLNFNMNLTCLMPDGAATRPQRCNIRDVLLAFLDFRFEVTKRRYEFELAALLKRIHILEGFRIIFDALDETIKIIRKSEGKKDAAQKIMKRFKLDEVQVEAILELKLYKLAKLEILVIREELAQKRKEAAIIEKILKSRKKLWKVVNDEILEIKENYGTPRRTKVGGTVEELDFDESAYIVDEDAHVVVTKDGWVKRVREVKNASKLRVREGDSVLAVLPGSTKANVAFFTTRGYAYVLKINDVPATTGYGSPAQKLMKFKDGERIIGAISLDPRAIVPDYMMSLSEKGFGQCFSIEAFLETTTKAGRRYAKPSKGDIIAFVSPVTDEDIVISATRLGYVTYCRGEDVNFLENPGKGVRIIKVGDGDRVIGLSVGRSKSDALVLKTEKGDKEFVLSPDSRKVRGRGGKGTQVVKRAKLVTVTKTIEIPLLANADGGKGVH